jgi:2-amino-4-hydroxy-6-hydroxymethyldihydropteridine diphosphokinase
MSDVLLSLGSNMGDRAANIAEAVRRLNDEVGVSVKALSPLYRTAPVGPVAQDDFINGAVRIDTTLAAEELMRRCLSIEASMGRDRVNGLRWGPRIIDIDMILFGDLTIATEALTLPHPRFRERAFVLVPLADIAPSWMIDGRRLDDLASAIDHAGIERA